MGVLAVFLVNHLDPPLALCHVKQVFVSKLCVKSCRGGTECAVKAHLPVVIDEGNCFFLEGAYEATMWKRKRKEK